MNEKEKVAALRSALQPLADLEVYVDVKHRNGRPAIYGIDTKNMTQLTIGHIRVAAAVLRLTAPQQEEKPCQ